MNMKRNKAENFSHLEKVVNNLFGLAGTKGSGSVHGDGDGRGLEKGVSTYDQIIAECKYTEKERKSLSISKKDFSKTEYAARRMGRIPAMFTSDKDGTVYGIMKAEDLAMIYRNHIEYVRSKE